MTEHKKILLKGISQLWGKGGRTFPNELNKGGCHRQTLDNKNLSPKEYFQYNAVEDNEGYEIFIIHDLNQNVLECVKCKDVSTMLEPCSNCGCKDDLTWHGDIGPISYSYYEYRPQSDNLICNRCEKIHQQNRWFCIKCGCDNTISNSLFHWVELDILPKGKPSCFIATVCYGDYNMKEVLVLRQFRDEKLLKTFFGKLLIKFYYSVSPFLAAQISKMDLLKKSVRKYFLEPIVAILQQENKR